ncbi:MAG: LLM class flavin-dependent oxidoreductase [Alphaproteobacteria bacterium]|nr:LLM class flavin-dependent oxidoreductase [Alphaproteobacteria bacterium]
MTGAKPLHFGLNLNNREALIAPGYGVPELLDMAVVAEEAGFDSVWVGDSLFSKPRYEPLALLAAVSQRTKKVRLGTACLVTATRNPLYLALEWATLDVISGGRTILGACMGNAIETAVQHEYRALGLEVKDRAAIFEEGLHVLRALWTEGRVAFAGKHFVYDDIAFASGTEPAPLLPVQRPPPMWLVSNPRMFRGFKEDAAARTADRAALRVARYGDGWLTCCRARHPDEVTGQAETLRRAMADAGRDPAALAIAYQVTMNVAPTEAEARAGIDQYISQYYPEMTRNKTLDLDEWGPIGTPARVARWIETFAEAGVTAFVCRFGAIDQQTQVARFVSEVLPRFR